MESSELKERLRKREDELKELKVNLNMQISGVYEQYQSQIEELKSQNSNLTDQLTIMTTKYNQEHKLRVTIEEDK